MALTAVRVVITFWCHNERTICRLLIYALILCRQNCCVLHFESKSARYKLPHTPSECLCRAVDFNPVLNARKSHCGKT